IVGIYEKTDETLRIFDSGHSYPTQRTVDLLTAAVLTLRPDVPGLVPYNVKCVMQPFSLYNRQFDGTSSGFFAALYAELYLLYGREGTFIEYFDVDRLRRRVVRLIAALQRGQIPEYKKPQVSMGLQSHIVYDGQLEFPLSELFAKADSSKVVLESSVVRGGILSGRILVRNLAYDKAVFVRSTYNGWKNYLNWDAVYESSPADGFDLFRFEAALPVTAEKVSTQNGTNAVTSGCAGYRVHDLEYWDSNGGKNYGVQLQRRTVSQETAGGYMHFVQQAEALVNRFESLVVVSSPPPEQELSPTTVSSLEVTVRIMQQDFEVESTEVTLAVDFAKECSADIARKVIGVLGDREGVSFESILVFDAHIADYVQLEESNVLVKGGEYVVLLSFDPTALQDDSHLLTECVVCGDQLVRTQGLACQHDDNEVLGVDYHIFCRECTRKYVEHSIHEMPLAPNRDGMKCMDPGCQRAICSATLRGILPADTMSLLDDRCMAENLAMLSGLE
ncbi:protein phosphatase 1 regulatory subunit 3C-B-like isoform 2, partial [Aphelenchoides avenae]